tara:strand:+ start:4170 stop:4430 length:261 start_codon:yes stop_codon:yes gene_type:complete
MTGFDLVVNGVGADQMGTVKTSQVVKEIEGGGCPACGCTKVLLMSFEIEPDPKSQHARLIRGTGVIKGSYVGCTQCDWKSKAMMYR